MKDKYKRAELLDKMNLLLAVGALPFAGILLLDALTVSLGNTATIETLDWIAKGALSVIVVWASVLIYQKFRLGCSDDLESESFSASILLRAGAFSWVVTFILLVQFYDRVFGSEGISIFAALPASYTGDVVAAFMLVAFSLAYFGFNLGSSFAGARSDHQ
jgi:hypothetical protein